MFVLYFLKVQSAQPSLRPFCSYFHSTLYCHFLSFSLVTKSLLNLPKKVHRFLLFSRFVDAEAGKKRIHLVGWVFLPPLRLDRCGIAYPKIYFGFALNFGRFWNKLCPSFLFILYLMITWIKRGK